MLHWLRALWYACHASVVPERFAAAKNRCFCRESLCSVEFIQILFFGRTVIIFIGTYLVRISRKTPCQADHAGSTSRVPWIASNSGAARAAESASLKPGQSACSKLGKIRERGLFVVRGTVGNRHVARVLERGVTFCGGLGELHQKNFKFKVANTPKFNDFLQLPKKFGCPNIKIAQQQSSSSSSNRFVCYNMQTYSSDSAVRNNDYSEDRMHSTSTSFLMAQR